MDWKPSARLAVLAGLMLCLTAVGIGAFGAHALKDLLLVNGRQSVFETASQYHFYHGLGLCLVGMLLNRDSQSAYLRYAAWLMLAGALLFSGSLYLLAVLNLSWLGAITPFGGVLLIFAWLMSFLAVLRAN